MKRSNKISVPLCLIFGIFTASMTEAAKNPNVLLIFVDDMGVKDIQVNGSMFYETPHINALAKSGVNFTNAYSSSPVCSPTRASLMTGKVPQRVGITQWIKSTEKFLPLSEVTIGEAFQQAGYRTGYIGKWHLGKEDGLHPQDQGFEYTAAVNRAGAPGSFFAPYRSGRTEKNVPDLTEYEKGYYLTDALTDKSLEFMNLESEKPFFLCLSHYAVHTPIEAPKTLTEKSYAST